MSADELTKTVIWFLRIIGGLLFILFVIFVIRQIFKM